MNWFSNCNTVGEIKSLFRELAFVHHPDRGGTNEAMRDIIDEYKLALLKLDGQQNVGVDGKIHTYYYNKEIEEEIINMVDKIIAKKLNGVNVEIVGTWIWVDGKTKPVKSALKDLGLIWHSKRSKWYWRIKAGYQRKYSGLDFNTLRASYGSKIVDVDDAKQSQVGI